MINITLLIMNTIRMRRGVCNAIAAVYVVLCATPALRRLTFSQRTLIDRQSKQLHNNVGNLYYNRVLLLL